MTRIAPRTSIANMPHLVTVQGIGEPISDDQGGFTREPIIIAERVRAKVEPATARNLERVVANAVQSSASHLVTIDYVPGVTTESQVVFHDTIDRTFSVSGVSDPEELHVQLVMACQEAGRQAA